MKAVVYWPLLLLLAGCSAFSGKDNADPPSELIELEPELRIEEVWDAGFEDADEAMLKLMPVISEGILYVAEPSGEVFALDPETGDRRWSVDTESPLSGGPGVAEGSIALGTLEAELILLNSEDGAERWRRRVSSEVLSSPVVNDNKVVCRTTDGGVAVYAVENGDKRWAYDRSVPVLTLRGDSSPMVNDYQVLAGFAGGK
ncbi:MAG: PQQ-binding-like beta-propeller repeat protein, partial [gamma proteobacterium symbiont of Ctena orbiculata]